MKKKLFSTTYFVIVLSAILSLSSCGGSNTSSSVDEYGSEGYGEFHNVHTGRRQTSYQGSVEQQEEIAILDKMIEEGY